MSSSRTTLCTSTSELDAVVPTTTFKEEKEKQWETDENFWSGMVEISQAAAMFFSFWKCFQKQREIRKSLLKERGRLNRQMEETDGIDHELMYRMREVSDRLNSCEENLMEIAGSIDYERANFYVGEGTDVQEFLNFYNLNFGYLKGKWEGVEKILEEVIPFLPDPDIAHEGKDWWGRLESDENFQNFECYVLQKHQIF